jgi:hypothetical protein
MFLSNFSERSSAYAEREKNMNDLCKRRSRQVQSSAHRLKWSRQIMKHFLFLLIISSALVLALSGCGSATVNGGGESTASSLSVSANTIAFGNVILHTTATQTVTLSVTGTQSVTINASVTGTGFSISSTTFPLTLSSGQSATFTVEFEPTITGAVAGQISITSDAATNDTQNIALTGTGAVAVAQLNWTAPDSTSDPIIGYNVYRALNGSSTYQMLNSSLITDTAYVDETVDSGLTYSFYATSEDSAGAESDPSNIIYLTIP